MSGALRNRGAVASAIALACTLVALAGLAGPPVPEAPSRYVTDRTGVLSRGTVDALEAKLGDFEADTSNQVWVYLQSTIPDGTTLEEYTVACAQAWRTGQTGKKNGLVLFVFPESRAARFEVGYGLEGALPDALAKQILDERALPRFREKDWNGGVVAAVDAALAATRGEYKGTGKRRPRPSQRRPAGDGGIPWPLILFFVFVVLPILFKRRPYFFIGGGGFGSGGGFGGFGGGGGGGFSGGGGSFGGGGASGRW